MNPEIIHDALTLLPPDLIQETDLLRERPLKTGIHWGRFAALAASLVLVLGSVMALQLRAEKIASSEAAPESPAMMQAAPAAKAPEAPAADAPLEEVAADEAAPEEYRDTNTAASQHTHNFAEPTEISGTGAHAYCGNTSVTIYADSREFPLSGSEAIAITDILIHLDYDPDTICNCPGSFTVDTETITGIQVNLEEGFARCEKGQAALTSEQATAIQEILDNLS